MTDIRVRLYQTLPNGWKIFQCHRSLNNNDRVMEVCMKRQPKRKNPLVVALGEQFFESTYHSDMMKIVRISSLRANDPVAVNTIDDENPKALQVGDILLAPPPPPTPTTIPLVAGRNVPLWKTGTLTDIRSARRKAKRGGQESYVVYFAQPPDEVTAVVATTTTTTRTSGGVGNP
jgi:hypothetical protein